MGWPHFEANVCFPIRSSRKPHRVRFGNGAKLGVVRDQSCKRTHVKAREEFNAFDLGVVRVDWTNLQRAHQDPDDRVLNVGSKYRRANQGVGDGETRRQFEFDANVIIECAFRIEVRVATREASVR